MVSTPISDTWERSDPYEQYVGRWSRRVASPFLSWLNVRAGRRWLDVGCGTGALSAAILDECSPVSVVGLEPSEGFLEKAKERLGARARLRCGSAAEIPLEDGSVDVTVSGLVLNFVPDGRAAVNEMARVATAGGTIGAYVWDYAGKVELMRHSWDAAVELDPDAATLDEGARFPSRTTGGRSWAARGQLPPTPWRSMRRGGRACVIGYGHASRCRWTARSR